MRLNSRVEKLIREACASTVGGAKFCTLASTSAPDRHLGLLEVVHRGLHARSRATGSST
jgi:hypothetical protein